MTLPEYLSGGRIQGKTTDTSGDVTTGWTIVGSTNTPNGTTGVFDFGEENNVTHLGSYDLGSGNVAGNAWALRCKMVMTDSDGGSSDANLIIGLSDSATAAGDENQDFIVMRIHNADVNLIRPNHGSSSAPRVGQSGSNQFLTVDEDTNYYIELKRTSDTQFTWRFTTNSAFTGGSSGTVSISAGTVTGLRYIKIMNTGNCTSCSTFTGYIDDLQYWADGDTTGTATHTFDFELTDESKAAITNVPEGTRYEETDTRKIFRREVGALDNDTGLRFHYKFDEASGDVINYGSVASADLTVSNLTRDQATPSGLGNGMSTPNYSTGYAQNTSRVNDYKFMHDGTAKWSVTFWFYATDLPDTGANGTENMIMGNVWTDDNGIGWSIRFAYDQSPTSSTTARIQTFIADGDAGMPLNDQSPNGMCPDLNAWHFYCVTYDPTLSSNHLTVTRDAATTGTGFHQGSEDNDTYSSSNPTRKVTYMSRPTGSYDHGAVGRIAQVTIWEDKILTQAEKVALYASGNGTTKLTSSWKEKGTA